MVTGHQAEEVETALAPSGVGFVRQAGQKGTGHAWRALANAKVEQHDGLGDGAVRRYSAAFAR